VDSTTPSPARLYDYYLGGTHNFPADRELAEKMKAGLPDVVDIAWANRGFHGRAAVWMADHGIRHGGPRTRWLRTATGRVRRTAASPAARNPSAQC